jgi:beta-lactamase class D
MAAFPVFCYGKLFLKFRWIGGVMLRLSGCFLVLLLVFVPLEVCAAEPAEAQAVQQILRAHDVVLALADLSTGAFFRYNEERCQQPLPALATLHLPLALWALDAGVIKDAQSVLPWNQMKYPVPLNEELSAWAQDHTLRSAFQQGILWYFQELTQRRAAASWRRSLQKMKFGHGDFPPGANTFATGDQLKISVEEQLAFLQALYEERLPLSKRAQRVAKELLIREQSPAYTLRAVSGSGMQENGKYLGWLVGWLETREATCVFALNLSGADPETVTEPAVGLLKGVLKGLGYLPKT